MVSLVLLAGVGGVIHRSVVVPWSPFGGNATATDGGNDAQDDQESEGEVYAAAMEWGWEAFAMNATGEAVPAVNLTEAVAYQQLEYGSEGCAEDLQIANQDECRLAIESLGKTVTDVWSGSATDVPRFCSATILDPNHTRVNFNSAKPNTTQGKSDVTPVCLTVPKPSTCPVCVSSKRIIPAVVIPFYERDLCKFGFTARSISIHDVNHVLGDVYFMWVSYSSPGASMSTIQGMIDDVNKTHTVHFYDLSGAVRGGGLPGWVAQQVLKLKIASVVTADYYMVLDSKNTLIKDLERDTLVTQCNQAKNFASYSAWNMPGLHKGWYASTAAHIGVPWPAGGNWPCSITPMILYTKTVIDMLHAVGENPNLGSLCGGPLCGWMGSQVVTEFTLYQLYARFRTNFDCNYATQPWSPSSALWRGQWRGPATFDWMRRNFFFGAQSGAFSGIGGWARTDAGSHLREIFVDAGLIIENNSALSPDWLMGFVG